MRRPLLLLGLLAALLAAALALELRDVAPTATEAPPPPDAAPPPPPAAAIVEPTQALLAAILARPLFEQDRRPAAETQAGPAADAEVRLAGILITPAGRAAIFAPADGGKPSVLHEGAALGPLTVRAIEPGAVTVLSHGKEKVLHPSFAASSATTTTPPPSLPFAFGSGALPNRPPGLPGGTGLPPNFATPGFTTSFAVPAAPPNLLGPGQAQPSPESRP